MRSRNFLFDLVALIPLDILQIQFGTQPLLRFPRFLKVSILDPFLFNSQESSMQSKWPCAACVCLRAWVDVLVYLTRCFRSGQKKLRNEKSIRYQSDKPKHINSRRDQKELQLIRLHAANQKMRVSKQKLPHLTEILAIVCRMLSPSTGC